MYNILCFGDSNTFGTNPSGGRWDRNQRWTGILQQRLGSDFYVIEEGLGGRTATSEDFLEPEDRVYFRECLVYDLYLRENRKSRPDFAKEPGKYREGISAFYKTEARERRYLPDYVGCDGKQLARQTHLEHFSRNPVTGTRQEVFLLFDYRRRDPLSLGAAVTEIQEGEFYSYAGI